MKRKALILNLIRIVFEKIAKIGKFHVIRERKINAFGNFMKTWGQN